MVTPMEISKRDMSDKNRKVAKRSTRDDEKSELQGGTAGGAGGLAGYVAGSRYSDARTDPWRTARAYGSNKPAPGNGRVASIKYAVGGSGKYKIAAAAGAGAAGGYGLTKLSQKRRHSKVSKRDMSDKNLKRAKKASATLSIGGGTLGLGGLAALAMKKPETAAKLSIGATGVGGIGSYNYAAIQRAEAKKRPPRQNVYVVRNKKQIKGIKSGLDPVTKNAGGMMDFGLSDVRHGENVSKARTLTQSERQKVDNAATAGALGAPAAGYFGSAGAKAGKAGYKLQRSMGTGRAASHAAGARTAVSGVKGAANGGRALSTWLNHPYKTLALVTGGSLAASAGTNKYLQSKPRKPVSKKDWMNISEHERRARDSRRTRKRGESAAGWGGTAIAGAVGHRAVYAPGRKPVAEQAAALVDEAKAGKAHYRWNKKHIPGQATQRATSHAKAAIKASPHGAVALAGGALMAGGAATMIGARANEKRHDRAVAGLRRKRVSKELVFKAYNPEGKRQRRLDNTATGLSVASGATALGAAKYGRDAVGQKEVTSHKWTTKPVKVKSKTNPTGSTKVINVSAQGRPRVVQVGTGLRSTNVTGYKAGLKSAGKAGGLGLAAVGLAVGSDRVRSYRRGNGGSYRQLHRGI